MVTKHLVPQDIQETYQVEEWRNATGVLITAHEQEWEDVIDALRSFHFLKSELLKGGGRKSVIAQNFDNLLVRRGWVETSFLTKIQVDNTTRDSPTHKVDCFKNGVGLEIKWNNKDPFFDRDLNNFRLLFDLRVIDVGIIVTRSTQLQETFKILGSKIANKYGSSTTHMDKLIPRLEGGGGGGCPILAFGISNKKYVEDVPSIVELNINMVMTMAAHDDLKKWSGDRRFATVLADPPWRFQNSTGKVAPEHRRLSRYGTLALEEIENLLPQSILTSTAHLYLWVPNALLAEGLAVMKAWGFTYKSNIVWHKVRKDGGSDGRGVGFYFRNVTELILFGVRGKNARTFAPGRRQVNYISSQKREHSRKPDELYPIIEACSPGPFLELFARGARNNWQCWGNESEDYYPQWDTYANHSQGHTPVNTSHDHDRTPVVSPASFIANALKVAQGHTLRAHDVYLAYEVQCLAQNMTAVPQIRFWQTLSAYAKKLGGSKQVKQGRVFYNDIRIAA